MRAFLLSLVVFSLTSSVRADEAQEQLALFLRERSQLDFLIGQKIEVDKFPLQAWDNQRPDQEAWRPASAQPLFSGGASLYIVHLWGIWCQPCITELPLLAATWTRFQSEPALKASVKIVLLAIGGGNPPAKIRERQREDWKQLGTPAVPLYLDGGSKLPQALGDQSAIGVPSFPTTLLVDRCGVIRQAYVGSLLGRRAAFDAAVRRLAAATAWLSCPAEPQQPKKGQ